MLLGIILQIGFIIGMYALIKFCMFTLFAMKMNTMIGIYFTIFLICFTLFIGILGYHVVLWYSVQWALRGS